MPRYLAIYVGTDRPSKQAKWDQLDDEAQKQKEAEALRAWGEWGARNQACIVDGGTPLGPTKRVAKDGIADITNSSVGYVIVEAETHQAAARLFENHPHFSIFDGDAVEVIECLSPPG